MCLINIGLSYVYMLQHHFHAKELCKTTLLCLSVMSSQTNTFQCILVSDGFMSFVIFLYADGLIQWTTGDASEGMGGLGGIPAQVGFNAGDRTNFASHPYSQTNDILNIASSSVPEGRAVRGMLVYRVDGRVIGQCLDTAEGKDVLFHVAKSVKRECPITENNHAVKSGIC